MLPISKPPTYASNFVHQLIAFSMRPIPPALICGRISQRPNRVLVAIVKAFSSIKLLRQSDTPQQVFKARVGAQAVDERINFKIGHIESAILIAPFKPLKCLIFLPESSIKQCKSVGRNVAMLGNLLQLVEGSRRLISLS